MLALMLRAYIVVNCGVHIETTASGIPTRR